MKKLLVSCLLLSSVLAFSQQGQKIILHVNGGSGGGGAETDPIWLADKPSYLLSATAASTYSILSHVHDYSDLTGLPTLFTQVDADALYSVLAHSHTFASLTSKPTTIAGYGIIDAFSQIDADALYQPIGTYATATNTMTFTNKSGNISQWTNDAGYLISSDLSGYLPLAGGTMTGNITFNSDQGLTHTSFSGAVFTASPFFSDGFNYNVGAFMASTDANKRVRVGVDIYGVILAYRDITSGIQEFGLYMQDKNGIFLDATESTAYGIKGMQNYSANYTSLSFVQKVYVDGLVTGLSSTYQPLDADLTSIAALTTTSFGRSLLTESSASTLKTTLSLNNVENAAASGLYSVLAHTHTFASLTSTPTTISGYGITDFNSLGDARWQPLDADLTTWAGITPGTGIGTFLATPTSANLASAITNETGSGSLMFNTAPQFTGGTVVWDNTANTYYYNTSDMVTNYERIRLGWASNTFEIASENGGSGSNRNISLKTTNRTFTLLDVASRNGVFRATYSSGTANSSGLAMAGTLSTSSGANYIMQIGSVVNQSSTAGYTALMISPFEQATGSGVKNLIDAGTNTASDLSGTHTSKFSVSDVGVMNLTGAATFGSIVTPTISANTTSLPAIKFTSSGASLMTTSSTGALEVDANGIPYYSHNTSERGVVDAIQFISNPTSTYTYTSQTALQKMFNNPTNGAFTLKANTTYTFECNFEVTGLSALSGNITFGFLGTATFTSLRYNGMGNKSNAFAAGAFTGASYSVATASVISSSTSQTTGSGVVMGIIRTNGAGTLIPAIGFSTVSGGVTPVLGLNSYFKLNAIGTDTVISVGNTN